jgi:hypothetical protein
VAQNVDIVVDFDQQQEKFEYFEKSDFFSKISPVLNSLMTPFVLKDVRHAIFRATAQSSSKGSMWATDPFSAWLTHCQLLVSSPNSTLQPTYLSIYHPRDKRRNQLINRLTKGKMKQWRTGSIGSTAATSTSPILPNPRRSTTNSTARRRLSAHPPNCYQSPSSSRDNSSTSKNTGVPE